MESKSNKLPFGETDEAMESLLYAEHKDLPLRSNDRKLHQNRSTSLLISVLLLLLTITTSLLLIQWKKNVELAYRPYSPANSALSYKQQRMFPPEDSIFYGPPSDEQDFAWADLLTPVNVRVNHEEMALGNETFSNVVQLLDGGYVVVLAVYHELHCLNIIRRYMYSDRFYPNATSDYIDYQREHITHCINVLRHFAMCHADVGMYSVEWIEDPVDRVDKQLKSNAQSMCVDWDQFDSWGRERAVYGKRVIHRKGTNVE